MTLYTIVRQCATQVSSPKKCSAVSLIAFIHPRESNSTFFSAGRSAKFNKTKRDFLVLYVNTCCDRWEEIFLLVSCGQTTLMEHGQINGAQTNQWISGRMDRGTHGPNHLHIEMQGHI